MTPGQQRVFEFVRDRCAAGLSPTITEIARELGMTGASARDFVDRLIRHGLLGRDPSRAPRGLFVPGGPDLRKVSTLELRLELERRGETLADVPSDPNFGGRKTCAADSCGEAVVRGQFFCKRHWFRLPKALRDEVLETFFARKVEPFQMALTRARDLIDGARPSTRSGEAA